VSSRSFFTMSAVTVSVAIASPEPCLHGGTGIAPCNHGLAAAAGAAADLVTKRSFVTRTKKKPARGSRRACAPAEAHVLSAWPLGRGRLRLAGTALGPGRAARVGIGRRRLFSRFASRLRVDRLFHVAALDHGFG